MKHDWNRRQEEVFAALPEGASMRYRHLYLPEGQVVIVTLTAPKGDLWEHNRQEIARLIFSHSDFFNPSQAAKTFARIMTRITAGVCPAPQPEPLPF